MTRAPDFIPEDTVQPPQTSDEAPLAPEGAEEDWKEALDVGHDKGPTSAHPDADWRAIYTARP